MSNQTSTSSRKRKADALEFADDSRSSSGRKLKVATTPSAHLPASCLAAILNFMEYAEVRRCLLAGKVMAVDAARHVETLNIMNASELVSTAARRFANVTDVHILSLLITNEDGNEDILSADTASRSVPFLMTFPKLKRAFIGGIWRDPHEDQWRKFPYMEHNCIEPKDHLSVFRGLVDYLSGAFRSRSLSPSLYLKGFVEDDQLDCGEHEDGHRCRHCWNIVASFPLDLVLKKIPTSYGSGLCLEYSERIEALATRHDNPLLYRPQEVARCFLAMAKEMFKYGAIDSEGEFADVKKSFIERIKLQGGQTGKRRQRHGAELFVPFHYIPAKDTEALKKLSAVIGPSVMSSLPKREILSAVSLPSWIDFEHGKTVFVRQTFESLVELGFDLASTDFVLIDPWNEAALRSYQHLFRSSEEEAS